MYNVCCTLFTILLLFIGVTEEFNPQLDTAETLYPIEVGDTINAV